ncbi:UNVERIFIED_CONTAM: Lysine-specific histone demethylase 12 [Sesamum radiatum]|uniref:Lysine-specific histone demethylase 12 n=1 Tax=Sesamum radiatum TaxID=300843 RepID=A0AAW2KI55_SESRA
MIALSLGFPIDELLDEEIRAGVVSELGGKEQNDYIVVRNHILAKWRDNVHSWLSKAQIKETDLQGWQQQGSSDPLVSKCSSSKVGTDLGEEFILRKMGQEGNYAAVDLGGSVITGIHANPLGVLARQLSIPSSQGSVLETLRQLYAVARSNEERQLLDWHFANLEFSNAGSLSNLSAAYWDQDDPYEMGGDHCFLAGGNWRLIRALCKGVPILYGKTVETIRYGNEGVEVIAGNQVFQADMVLCTVPLGVLKKGKIRFEPELPEKKQQQ